MADKFVLTAQLQLQAPTNVNQVLNQVRSQLAAGNTNIQANIQTTGMAQANKQMQNLGKSAQSASASMKSANTAAGSLVKTLGAAARRFAAITVATGTFLAIARSIGEATRKAIEFETEMIKISQVTGKSLKSLQGLNKEVTKIATSMGVSSQEILGASRTLLQAGFSADKVRKSLVLLAQTDLAATFDSIQDSTEGAIALLRQFRNEAQRAGGDVKFLEQSLNAINAVSKNFAVESADLITVIRKTGGVFEAAGGSLNELLALFTSVRATTRESADTIATGFRTIFTRIQRTETIEQLKELGIVLQDSTGKFVGPLEAIRRLQAGLAGLDPRDYRFNEIVEQLGGFRQIGKVIPLLKQYGTTAEALAIANAAAGENAADAAKAQQGLGNQVTKLKEKFDALVRTFIDSKTFKSLASGAIALAEAFIRIAESLEPLLPMLTTLVSLKLGQMVLPSIGKFAMGGGPKGFNKGGLVPGQGNFDTVPAMLTPGEFVMRKSAVKNIGASNMASMNARGYAAGGKVSGTRNFYGNGIIKQDDKMLQNIAKYGLAAETGRRTATATQEQAEKVNAMSALQAKPLEYYAQPQIAGFATLGGSKAGGRNTYRLGGRGGSGYDYTNGFFIPGSSLTNADRGIIAKNRGLEPDDVTAISSFPARLRGSFSTYTPSHASLTADGRFQNLLAAGAKAGLERAFDVGASALKGSLDLPPVLDINEDMIAKARSASVNDDAALGSIEGYLQEGMISAISGAIPAAGQAGFDLPAASLSGPIKERLGAIYGADAEMTLKAELKRSLSSVTDKVKGLPKKTANDIMAGDLAGVVERFARGGAAKGSDTVPAMLTPGEFVINKKSAAGIGYANLQRMNQSGGVQGYAAGGIVNARRNNYGILPFGGGGGGNMSALQGSQMANEALIRLASSAESMQIQINATLDEFPRIQQSLTAAANGAQGLATIDERILQSINTGMSPLLSGFTDAGAGFMVLDANIYNYLIVGAAELVGGLKAAAQGIKGIPSVLATKLNEGAAALVTGMSTIDDLLIAAIAPLKQGLADAGAGIGSVDDMLRARMQEAVTPLDGAMQNTAGGISSIDEMLRGAIMEAVAPLDRALQGQNIQQVLADFVATVTKLDKQFERLIPLFKPIEVQAKDFAASLKTLNTHVDSLSKNLMLATSVTSEITTHNQAHLKALNQLTAEEQKEAQQLAASNPTPGAGAGGAGMMMGAGGGGGGGAGGMMGQNMMMLAMSISMVTSELTGMDEAVKKAINSFAMTFMVGAMLAQTLGDMTKSGYQSVMAKRAETKAALKNAAAKSVNSKSTLTNSASKGTNTAANNVNTASKNGNTAATNLNSTSQVKGGMMGFTGGTAGGRMAAGVGPSMMAGAAIYAAFQAGSAYFAEKAKMALEESTESFENALELSAEGDDAGSREALARSISQGRDALANESLASGLSATGIGAGIGATIGGILGSVIPGFGTALGIAAGGVIGGLIGSAFGDWSSTIEGQALEDLANSAYNLSVGMQKMDAAILQIQEGGFDAATSMTMLRAATEEYKTFQDEAAKAQARYNALIQDEEAKGDLADSEAITKWTEMEAEAREQAAQKAMDYARMERETRDALIDDLAAQGGDIEGIFNNPQIQAARQAYIQYLVDSGKLTMEQATKVANEVDANKKKEIQAARDARKAAQEAAAARLAEIRLIKEHNQVMLSLNQALGALAAAGEDLTITQGILNNEFKKMPTAISNSLTTTLSNFNSAGLEEYSAALDTATADAPKKVRDAANKSQFYKKLFTQAESQLEGLVGDSGQLSADQSLTEEGARSENVQAKFNKSFATILDSLPPDVRKQVDANLKKAAKDGVIDATEFAEILKPIEEAGKRGAEEAIKWVKIQQEYSQRYLDVSNALIATIQKENDARAYAIEVEERGRKRLEEATGKKPDRFAAENARRNAARARLGANAGLLGDVEGLKNVVVKNTKTVLANKEALNATNKKYDKAGKLISETRVLSEEDQKRVAAENVKLAQESANATAELKRLADQSERASDVMAEIELERSKRETISGAIKEFTFASNQGRAEINKSYFALSRVLQTGNLNSIPDEMRGAVGGLLDDFADIEIFGGMTGADISKQLQVQTMDQQLRMVRGRGLTDDEKKRIYESTPKEDQLIDELRAINAEEKAAADALAQIEKENTETMKAMLGKIDSLLDALKARIDEGSLTLASGGLVAYKAGGGSIFKPRGTDTVPAMLTPGEFVIKKSAVDKVGVGTLSAINNGGSPVYKAEGGLVGGDDGVRLTARNMGVRQLRAAFGLPAAQAYNKNSVADLIAATGADNSPFKTIKDTLDIISNYQDIFSTMSNTGVSIKPEMKERFQSMMGDISGLTMDRLDQAASSLGQYNPGFFAGLSALNSMASSGSISAEGSFGVSGAPSSGGRLSKEEARKQRAQQMKDRRHAKGTVPEPRFDRNGNLIPLEPGEERKRIPYHEFVKRRDAAKAEAKAIKAREQEAAAKAAELDRKRVTSAEHYDSPEGYPSTLFYPRHMAGLSLPVGTDGSRPYILGDNPHLPDTPKHGIKDHETLWRTYGKRYNEWVKMHEDKYHERLEAAQANTDEMRFLEERGMGVGSADVTTGQGTSTIMTQKERVAEQKRKEEESAFNQRMAEYFLHTYYNYGNIGHASDMFNKMVPMLDEVQNGNLYGPLYQTDPPNESMAYPGTKPRPGFESSEDWADLYLKSQGAIPIKKQPIFPSDEYFGSRGEIRGLLNHFPVVPKLDGFHNNEKWKFAQDTNIDISPEGIRNFMGHTLGQLYSDGVATMGEEDTLKRLGYNPKEMTPAEKAKYNEKFRNTRDPEIGLATWQGIADQNMANIQAVKDWLAPHMSAAAESMEAGAMHVGAAVSTMGVSEIVAADDSTTGVRDLQEIGLANNLNYENTMDALWVRAAARYHRIGAERAEMIAGRVRKIIASEKSGRRAPNQGQINQVDLSGQKAQGLIIKEYQNLMNDIAGAEARQGFWESSPAIGVAWSPYQATEAPEEFAALYKKYQSEVRNHMRRTFYEAYGPSVRLYTDGPSNAKLAVHSSDGLGGSIYDTERRGIKYAQGLASGGPVDTVPAMLTPGEFVMNNSAVSKYGTGFMRALNQGRVQGFNKGGLVYAANGSQGGVSGGSGIDNIMGGNSDQLERIAQTFALVMKAFTSVANIFGNMSMTHQVNFGGSIKIDFPNADMISASIAQGAAAQISQMVDEKIESAIENLQNGPG